MGYRVDAAVQMTIDDTLSRRNVIVDGVRYRQRYNLAGSDGYGLEASLDWRISERIELRLTGARQNHTARKEEDGTRPVLYQRPEFQAALALDCDFGRG
jgi:hypothetical protein